MVTRLRSSLSKANYVYGTRERPQDAVMQVPVCAHGVTAVDAGRPCQSVNRPPLS
jgi:hypothetical protein